MSKYTIYLRRNTINGKVYIGQTKDFKQREKQWKCLKAVYANQYLIADRAEFGLENWKTEILAEADNKENAWELEKRFIADFNSLWPNGYNISTGGHGSSGVHNKHSEEVKQKISENNAKFWKGKHHSEEAKAKRSKPVYQYTLDGVLKKVWPSTMECGRNGYKQSHVVSCCNGKRKTHKGHIWSFKPL